jgi:hypothetical protein
MKKIFLVVTERGRSRGKISFYIAEIEPTTGLRLIDNTFTCSITSNKGIKNEAVKVLIKNRQLPEEALDQLGYINYNYNEYQVIIVEGQKQGLNYIDQIN